MIKTYRYFLLFLTVTFLPALQYSSTTCTDENKTTTVAFRNQPFETTPTIAQLKNSRNPKYKLKKYIFKKYPTDTIYQFNYKKSAIFFNRSVNKSEIFFSANIQNKQIQLNNGIAVGMEKEKFLSTFTDLQPTQKDTIEIKSAGQGYNISFFFKKGQLKQIKIENQQRKTGN